jgi:lysine--8-amino-7-oxononanoate aminotransferase
MHPLTACDRDAPGELKLPSPEQLVRNDREFLIHPLHDPNDTEHPVIYARGRGVMVHDIHGNEYVDGLSGL